jgi:hypothetical protein
MLDPKLIETLVSAVDARKRITTDATGSHSTTLKAYERDVIVDSTLGIGTVRLPDVSEAKGKLYSVNALTGNANTVTVAEYSTNNSFDWAGDSALNAAKDRGLYYSDGQKWWVITDMFT